jgi:HPt (histidine-containing phosphotransfer) domain-containing protein
MLTASAEIYSTLVDDEDLLELVQLFVDELPERLAKLVDALHQGEIAEVGRYAHQLKGAAGSYGFDAVTPFAARLEKSARSGEPEDAVEAALSELLEMCSRLRAGIPA